MDSPIKRAFQELIASVGWKYFVDSLTTDKIGIKSFKSRIQDKVNAEVRAENMNKASYYQGQLDIIEQILKVPEQKLNNRA